MSSDTPPADEKLNVDMVCGKFADKKRKFKKCKKDVKKAQKKMDKATKLIDKAIKPLSRYN